MDKLLELTYNDLFENQNRIVQKGEFFITPKYINFQKGKRLFDLHNMAVNSRDVIDPYKKQQLCKRYSVYGYFYMCEVRNIEIQKFEISDKCKMIRDYLNAQRN